jgi:hypothetical protein
LENAHEKRSSPSSVNDMRSTDSTPKQHRTG